MKLTLTYSSGANTGKSLSFESGHILLGRDMTCSVVFDPQDTAVSRQHAEIVFDGNNWQLQTLSQTNQTIVNGAPVQQATLRNGDTLTLGVNGPTVSVSIEGELAATVAVTPQQLGLPVNPSLAPTAQMPPTNPINFQQQQPLYQPPPSVPHSTPMQSHQGSGVPYSANSMAASGPVKGGNRKLAFIIGGISGLVILVLVGVVVIGLFVATGPTRLFSADFIDKGAGWKYIVDNDAGSVEFGNSRLRMTAAPNPNIASIIGSVLGTNKGEKFGVATTWYTNQKFNDFDYRIKAKQTKGEVSPYGMVFRLGNSPDSGDWYGFFISRSGKYSLIKVKSGMEPIVDWTPDSSIKTDLDAENTLRVVADGSKIKLYVNDKFLNSSVDTSYSEGYLGTAVWAIGDTCTVDFSKLEVFEVPKKDK